MVPKICKPDDPLIEELLATKAWLEWRYPEKSLDWNMVKSQMRANKLTPDDLRKSYEFFSNGFGIKCVKDLYKCLVESWKVKAGGPQRLGVELWSKDLVESCVAAIDWSMKNVEWECGKGDWDAMVKSQKGASNDFDRRRVIAVWAQRFHKLPHDRSRQPFGTFGYDDRDAAVGIFYGITRALGKSTRKYKRELEDQTQNAIFVLNSMFDAKFLPIKDDRKSVNDWAKWFAWTLFVEQNPHEYFMADNVTLYRVRLQVIKDASQHKFFGLRQLAYFYHNCMQKT